MRINNLLNNYSSNRNPVWRYPKGMEYVFVNGVALVEKEKQTEVTPGKVIKR